MAVAAHHIFMAKSPLGLSPAEALPVFPTETEAASEPATETGTATEFVTETETATEFVTETGTSTEFVTEPSTEFPTEGDTEFPTDEVPSEYPILETVSSNKANGTGGGTIFNVDKPAGLEEGDLIIAVLTSHRYVSPSGASLGDGSHPFSSLDTYSRSNGTNVINTTVYKRVAGASEPDTYPVSLGSYVYGVVTLLRISHWDPDATIFINHSSGGSSTSHAAPSITTDENGNLIIAVSSLKVGSSSFTPPAGMTEVADVANTSSSGATHSLATLDQASAGATGTKTFTSAAAADWVGFTVGIHHLAASAPVITSADTITINEGETAVMTVTATDADTGDTVEFSLVGGDDRHRFIINGTTGVLAFKYYVVPGDYQVRVRASDGVYSSSKLITVTVEAVTGYGDTETGSEPATETETATQFVTETETATEFVTETETASEAPSTPGPVPVVESSSRNSGNSGTTSGSLTVTKPSGVADDDYLFAQLDGTRYMRSITPPSGWSTAYVHYEDDADGQQVTSAIYYKRITNAAGEPADYTWNFASSIQSWNVGISISRISGVNPTTPLDVAVEDDITGGNPVYAAAITTVTDNCLILRSWVYSWGTSTIGSPSGGETTISSGTVAGNQGGHTWRHGYKSATTAGTVAASSCSASNSSYHVGVSVAIRPKFV